MQETDNFSPREIFSSLARFHDLVVKNEEILFDHPEKEIIPLITDGYLLKAFSDYRKGKLSLEELFLVGDQKIYPHAFSSFTPQEIQGYLSTTRRTNVIYVVPDGNYDDVLPHISSHNSHLIYLG